MPAFAQKVTVSYPLAAVIENIQKKPCGGNFGFAVFADTHASKTVFPFLLSIADKLEPAFIMDAGDFTNNGTDEEYELVISQVTKIKSPFLFVPGNHEYRTPEGKTSNLQRKRYGKIFGMYDYAFDYCGWRFIGVDVVALDMLSDAQLSWLDKTLEGTKGKSAIFFHYPTGSVPKWKDHPGTFFKSNADKFAKLVQKHKVRYVFSGHLHVYDRIKVEDTIYVLVGAGGGGPDDETSPEQLNASDAGGYYGFVYVSVEGDKTTDVMIRPNLDDPWVTLQK